MLEDISNFGLKRSLLGALAFYIVYLILLFVFSLFVGFLAGGLFDFGFEEGVKIGLVITVSSSMGLAMIICYSKGIMKEALSIFLILIAGIIALLFGALGGLIPATLLSLRKNKKDIKQDEEADFCI